jgi:hypothetical protein
VSTESREEILARRSAERMVQLVNKVITAVSMATKELYEVDETFQGEVPDEATRVATIVNLLFAVLAKASTDPDFPLILGAVAIDRLMQADLAEGPAK